eukprot:m.6715 g.6715  ORF g.6715 m.6715 type:complete len:1593 (-) comp3572_c0_seq2:173-4951(-)
MSATLTPAWAASCSDGWRAVSDNVACVGCGPFLYMLDIDNESSQVKNTIHGGPIQCLSSCPDHGLIAYAECNPTKINRPRIFIVESDGISLVTSLEMKDTSPEDDVGRMMDVSLSPDGQYVVSLGEKGVVLFHVDEGAEVARLHLAGGSSISFNPENINQMAVMTDNGIQFVAIEQCGPIYVLTARPVVLASLPKKRIGRRRMSAEKALDLGRFIDNGEIPVPASMAWSPTNVLFVTTSLGTVIQVDPEDLSAATVIQDIRDAIGSSNSCCCTDSDLVVCGENGTLFRYELRGDLRLKSNTEIEFPVTNITYIYRDTVLAAAQGKLSLVTGEGTVSLLQSHHSTSILGQGLLGGKDGITAVTFDKTGLGLLWDTMEGTVVDSEHVGATVTAISVCKLGQVVAIGTEDGIVNLYETSKSVLRLVWSEQVQKSKISHLQVSADAQYIFSLCDCILGVSRYSSKETKMEVVGYHELPSNNILSLTATVATESNGEHLVIAAHRDTKDENSSVITCLRFPDSKDIKFGCPLNNDSTEQIKQSSTTVPFIVVDMTATTAGELLVTGGDTRLKHFSLVKDESIQPLEDIIWLPKFCRSKIDASLETKERVLSQLGTDGGLLTLQGADIENTEYLQIFTKIPLEIENTSQHLVSISSCGRRILATGHFGEVVMCTANLPDEENENKIASVADLSDLMTFDAVVQPWEKYGEDTSALDALRVSLEVQAVAGASDGEELKDQMRQRIAKLREQVLQLMKENETKPELEQLSPEEFQLDISEQEKMQEEEERALATLKEEIELKILAQQFLRNEVKKEVWDKMETKGATLYGVKLNLEVSNFPIRKQTAEELNELAKVKTAREIEMLVEETENKHSRANLGVRQNTEQNKQVPTESTDATQPEQGEAAEKQAPSDGTSKVVEDLDEDEDEGQYKDIYNPLTLRTAQRKRSQIVLLKNVNRKIMLEFNKEFEDLHEDKLNVKSQILDRNEKIKKVVAELKLGGATELKVNLFTPKEHILETPEKLLEVDPSEIKVKKVLNAEERAQKAEADRLEAERLAREALDNPLERGVNDMMYGRLEGKGDEEIWEDIPAPEFSDQPADELTDGQRKKLAAYKQEVSARDELRDKRRKLLNSDLASLEQGVETLISGFDKRLEDCFKSKISKLQQIIRNELQILKLAKILRDEEEAIEEEERLTSELKIWKLKRNLKAKEVESAEMVVNEVDAEYQAIRREDNVLDKTFKTRIVKACPGQEMEDYMEALVRLYRKRPKRSKMVLTENIDKADYELDEEDYPEGLDESVWERFQELRWQKIDAEINKRVKEEELAEKRSFLQRRVSERDEADHQSASILDQLQKSNDRRMEDAIDVELILAVKQGQVEMIHGSDFEPDFSSAVLIEKDVVDSLNSTIRNLGDAKIQHMTNRMDYRKGIHMLEWEHKRLDMEAEDLIQKTKDVQMLRVTRHMTLDGGKVSAEERHRKENDVLERTIQQQEALQRQLLTDRKRRALKLKREINKTMSKNEELDPKIEQLCNDIDERATLCRVQLQATGQASKAKTRARDAAARRKLVDTVRKQSDEIAFLQDELERLRMKTFPAFLPGQRPAF